MKIVPYTHVAVEVFWSYPVKGRLKKMKGSKKEGGSRKGEWKLDGKVKNMRITQMEL